MVVTSSPTPAGAAPVLAPTLEDHPVDPVDVSEQGEMTSTQLTRWGAVAGLAGVAALIGSVVAVGAWGLPDASEVETLTDFPDIEIGRIVEHFFYLGALVFFALHVTVLQRLLRSAHQPASLFGAVVALFGLVIMAASSVLHVSTAPLSELYVAADTADDRRSIEYAWHSAQSVFDAMLATGVLLVPIGLVLFGVAMRNAREFGRRLPLFTIFLAVIGIVGAAIAIVDPGSLFAAASVVAIAVVFLCTGWRMLQLGRDGTG